MPELVYRAATADDLPFIVNLITIDDVATPIDDPANANAAYYLAALAAIEADPNQSLHVAELDGSPVGTFQLTFIPGIARKGMWRGVIEAVHIAPEHRAKGYGSQMIRWTIEACRARGCGMVQLTSNKKRVDAHRFYRRLGFEQSHEGFKLYL